MRARALLAAAALIIALPASTSGAQGFPNPAVSFVKDLPAGGMAIPLINSGDKFNGTTFQGIPDGIGIVPVGDGSSAIDIYVNFEQSHVPFGGFADFSDSSVQRARLDLNTMQLVKLTEVLPDNAGFIRFCSATMLGPDQGFANYTFLVNEESNDVLPAMANQPYGADPVWAAEGYRQAGYTAYLDTKTGKYGVIAGVGRMNHENTVVVPGGWNGVYAVTGDDTFSAPSSQLYLYGASSANAFLKDQGSLWAFRVTEKNGTAVDPEDSANGANDFLDIMSGDTLRGAFIQVPDDIARGTHGGAPQTDLENWSNANNVFQFVRIEDIAYDPDNPRDVYFTDTGTTRLKEDAGSGRLIRAGSSAFPYFNTNGRVFKLTMDAGNPTLASLEVFAEGLLQEQFDASTFNTIAAGVGFLNPDNIAIGQNTMMVQEDASTFPTNNDIWNYSFGGGTWTKVASVTQNNAETSGIVDASAWLGAGWWIFDVQSHENLLEGPGGLVYQPLPSGTPLNYNTRLEVGQLLLLYIPGS